ncbi:thrombomodulin-like [Spea bombifrons]|uniref:thrombomodulin-like n=1 Tax=Spea bombifrons TaxID=233779 RepID=UPI0023490408|nr:thrombomodulin-like [Spea bombifrons]
MLLIPHIIFVVLALAHLAYLAPTDQQSLEFVCINKTWYAIALNSKKYQGATKACKKQNGHLMTVRSSVEADAISLLMDKTAKNISSVWIGLELPSHQRCTDLGHHLRGFTWVTGDNNTDYYNWRNREKKCGAQCVSVSRDQFWEETDCDTKTDGFLCEFTFPQSCRSIYLPEGYSATYQTPFGIVSTDSDAMFPPNTYATVSNVDVQLVCRDIGGGNMKWISETPGAWSCFIENGGCEFICEGDHSKPTCLCNSGSNLKEDGRTCSRPCDPKPCDHHCVAVAERPGFICVCYEGYTLVDGTKCEDIDDCAANPDICEQKCSNTEGSFTCSCHPGFEMIDARCEDINECEAPFDQCEHDCINTLGSFHCGCSDGYIVDEKNPKKCRRFCETPVCEAECDLNTNACTCPEGYVLDDESWTDSSECVDIDECEASHCKELCINTYGSYECVCPIGYILQPDTSCKYDDSSAEPSPATPTAPEIFTSPPGPVIHTLQPAMLLGICVGILSMLIVIIAIICHMVRKRYMDNHTMDYKGKNSEKDVVLQQVKTAPQQKL